MARHILGILLIICGIGIAGYIGIWWCFIGGIVQIIEQIRAPNLSAILVAIGVLKVFAAGFCGIVSGIILVIPGVSLIK